ncbi:MAG TPA: hypothetical protein P5034_09515 [Rectinema sp.]|nr:hypothetical protein [Rectinema sp.]
MVHPQCNSSVSQRKIIPEYENIEDFLDAQEAFFKEIRERLRPYSRSRGYKIIIYLWDNPDYDISIEELGMLIPHNHSQKDSYTSTQDDSKEQKYSTYQGVGGWVKMVDYKYIRDLKREQRRLREKVKLLRQSGEEEKANKLQEEYDFIRKFYTEVTLNGKPRYFMNYTKREYQRLSQMINRLLAKIKKNDPILSAYLKKHLKIGYKCMWKTDV